MFISGANFEKLREFLGQHQLTPLGEFLGLEDMSYVVFNARKYLSSHQVKFYIKLCRTRGAGVGLKSDLEISILGVLHNFLP
jgi:hypothetical protein